MIRLTRHVSFFPCPILRCQVHTIIDIMPHSSPLRNFCVSISRPIPPTASPLSIVVHYDRSIFSAPDPLPPPIPSSQKARKAKETAPFRTHHPTHRTPRFPLQVGSPSSTSPRTVTLPFSFSPFSGRIRRRVQGLDEVYIRLIPPQCTRTFPPPSCKVGCSTDGCCFFLFVSANPFPTQPHYHLFLQPFSCDAMVFPFPIAQLTPHFAKLRFGS